MDKWTYLLEFEDDPDDLIAVKEVFSQTIKDLSSVIKLNPKDAYAYYNRGLGYCKISKIDKAIVNFTKAIELNPNFIEAYIARGNAYRKSGTPDWVIQDCTNAIDLNPTYTLAYIIRGFTYYKKGDLGRALADFNKVIELNPKDARAYSIRGNFYCQNNNLDKALADFNTAIEFKPNGVNAYISRGIVYSNKGDYDSATADFNMAIKLYPKYSAAYFNRGNMYRKTGNLDLAIADYIKIIILDLCYNNIQFDHLVDILYADNDKLNKKLEEYDNYITSKMLYPDYYYFRGLVYTKKSAWDKAIADFTMAIELSPLIPELKAILGMAYQIKNDKEKAKYWYQETLTHKYQLTSRVKEIVQQLLNDLEKQPLKNQILIPK